MTRFPRKRPRVDMYTDGACSGPNGPGGWAWAVLEWGIEGSGYVAKTTNQRMEMTAVFEGLLHVFSYNPTEKICVVTDSAYVMNCFVDGWYKGWKNGKKRNGDPVANWDIWRMLIPLVLENDVTWRKVKGHSGDHGNEYVDRLAVAAKKGAM